MLRSSSTTRMDTLSPAVLVVIGLGVRMTAGVEESVVMS
jgi:hypothetical protein